METEYNDRVDRGSIKNRARMYREKVEKRIEKLERKHGARKLREKLKWESWKRNGERRRMRKLREKVECETRKL